MSEWTFISNHGAVLALVTKHEQITVREIASELGITERSVHRIISDLEDEGYIGKKKLGRTNSYHVTSTKSLRRPELAETRIGELLNVLLNNNGGRKKKATSKFR